MAAATASPAAAEAEALALAIDEATSAAQAVAVQGVVQQKIKHDLLQQLMQVGQIVADFQNQQMQLLQDAIPADAFQKLEKRLRCMQHDLSYLNSWWQRQFCCCGRSSFPALTNHSDFLAGWTFRWSLRMQMMPEWQRLDHHPLDQSRYDPWARY
mmetsp:Transcript_54812/g.155288  ORF Transcript_54812/g.155288 Transcript_54812/m.155288 type:complete len:155 (+) Transcript_54812:948-1412(+)